ncbi:MAG: tRNA (guanosine(46)-N7)-methyltransferase TrmB [Sphaerochaeta sp.]|jgi:tRNA (guanine-N7-)-methyltransferase|nr:tRNA (guanosine(46)-N7)-methyltransferase TrmB [Sphaerochaeta sp.]MDX9914999.1 tRNA (guanosine(46)-N7)-methyltransferase TrmB [Sphaerochaeta sp.]
MRETQETIFEDVPDLRTVEREGVRSVKSFVLRGTRLKRFQVEAVRAYYHDYVIPYEERVLDFTQVFNNDKPLVIEIGFGMGVATHLIAKERTQYNYLAIEVFLSGFTKLLDKVGKEGLENIRLMRFDAVAALTDMVGDSTVAGFHIFFPDPWPKKRQHKRRLIQREFAALLARKLVPGGYIYAVTDWVEYAEQMLEVFDSVEELENPHHGFSPPVSWRPQTRFEEKGRQQEHQINEVWVQRRG